MADNFKLSDFTSGSNSGKGPDASNPGGGSSLNTGDLRRKYNFGDRVSELNIAQDPFFRFVSKVAKKPCDDPKFKFTERRGSWHKRYAYVTAHGTTNACATTDASVADGLIAAGDTYFLKMGTDYMSEGNRQNVYNQSTNAIAVGAAGTQPGFFLPGQVVKCNMGADGVPGTMTEYILGRIVSVDTTSTSTHAVLEVQIIKGLSGANYDFCSFASASAAESQVYDETIHSALEIKRCYVVGSAFGEGTGYPETWKDQPFSTGYGQTQIWKTSCAMTNTARATVLKYEGNEWARVWREKLIEHKYDIEQSLLFGSQYEDANGITYTQGAVDFISNYGNVFSLPTASKTQDSFLDDLSSYLDPRYNNSGATVYFCNTAVFNWLHKLGGYFKNNLEIGNRGVVSDAGNTNPFTADMAITGKKMAAGVGVTTISTVYGDMNVVRNIHLDGTNVQMLGIDMKHCAYRPLVGNGMNRDTSVYVGVQTLENSGVDRRVDQILTEAGMEWSMPEAHAVWTA
mgnify:CR=1 FL=1